MNKKKAWRSVQDGELHVLHEKLIYEDVTVPLAEIPTCLCCSCGTICGNLHFLLSIATVQSLWSSFGAAWHASLACRIMSDHCDSFWKGFKHKPRSNSAIDDPLLAIDCQKACQDCTLVRVCPYYHALGCRARLVLCLPLLALEPITEDTKYGWLSLAFSSICRSRSLFHWLLASRRNYLEPFLMLMMLTPMWKPCSFGRQHISRTVLDIVMRMVTHVAMLRTAGCAPEKSLRRFVEGKLRLGQPETSSNKRCVISPRVSGAVIDRECFDVKSCSWEVKIIKRMALSSVLLFGIWEIGLRFGSPLTSPCH